jgi:transposase
MGAKSTSPSLTDSGDGLDPSGPVLYVGLDVGRRAHVVSAIPRAAMEDGSWERAPVRRVVANADGFTELIDWLAGLGTVDATVVACEPTGGWYTRTVVAWLEVRGYRVTWLQNWALHERRQLAIGKQTKTDALDARLLARLLYERDRLGGTRGLLQRRPASAEALRLLVRNRLKLVTLRTRYRLQLGVLEDVVFPELKEFFRSHSTGQIAREILELFPTPAALAAASPDQLAPLCKGQGRGVRLARRLHDLQALAANSVGLVDDTGELLTLQRWLLRQLRIVDEEIDNADATIGVALQGWPHHDRAILASFPCMSIHRQAVLFSTMGDWRSFQSDRQLRKLIGWYPEARESGTSVSKHRLGEKGNRLARREVWLWAVGLLSPKTPPTPFRAYYERLRARGVRGNVAVGHVAGKLISVVFHCLKTGEHYDPDRHGRALGLDDA